LPQRLAAREALRVDCRVGSGARDPLVGRHGEDCATETCGADPAGDMHFYHPLAIRKLIDSAAHAAFFQPICQGRITRRSSAMEDPEPVTHYLYEP
jgi:hypothetical protein